MEIDKLIEKIAEEVYRKVTSEAKAGSDIKGYINSGSTLASMIDHTMLKPAAAAEKIVKICREAREYKFASVCVRSSYASLVTETLDGSGVKTCCVIGFPLGAASTRSKIEETRDAVANGANEVDMVINIGALKSGNWDFVKKDVEAVVSAAKGKALVKVIIETCLLTDEEKVKACTVSKIAGADFVKTSTGFSTGGAKVEDVKLMRQVVGPGIGVKASGGVRDYKTAMAMVNAGANRIGTSSGIAIVKNENSKTSFLTEAGTCIQCGACNQSCPTGNVSIIKSEY